MKQKFDWAEYVINVVVAFGMLLLAVILVFVIWAAVSSHEVRLALLVVGTVLSAAAGLGFILYKLDK
jgi:uncharacterized membrane protein